MNDRIRAAADLVEGSWMRVAAMRGVLTGMSLLVRTSFSHKVCVSLVEASEFIATQSRGRLVPRDVVRVILSMRD